MLGLASGPDVALVDTGVEASVPVGQRWHCRRVCRPAPAVGDTHGTLVARTIFTAAPDAVIDSYDVTDRFGAVSVRAVAAAIRHAGARGTPVINVSLTVSGRRPGLQQAVAQATDSLVVAAAGNEGRRMRAAEPLQPCMAASANVLCVTSPGGNFGSRWVDLVAPGKVTFGDGPFAVTLRGSSAAAAHVSGWAVRASSGRPLTPAELKARLVPGAPATPRGR
jgi:subtilisin family serine protease